MYPGWYTRTYTREVYTHQGASSTHPPTIPGDTHRCTHPPYHTGYPPLYTPLSTTLGIHRCTHPLSPRVYTVVHTLSHTPGIPRCTPFHTPGIPRCTPLFNTRVYLRVNLSSTPGYTLGKRYTLVICLPVYPKKKVHPGICLPVYPLKR